MWCTIYTLCVLDTIKRQETKYKNILNENSIDTLIEAWS
jgi:tRNA uridine 5-carbamoylmethylation protein Kti12